MKAIIVLLAASLWLNAVSAQNFPVGRSSTTIIDETRSNRQIPVDLFYPATVAGSNTPVSVTGGGFPLVVFGHGFLINTSAYTWLGDSLAKNGFIAVFPGSEGGLLPSHGQFGADLRVVSQKVLAWNSETGSAFFGRVIQRAAVSGHSMGGGASFLAASPADANVKALFNFAAAETNPSTIDAAAGINIPSLIFSGSRDCIVPPATQLSMYQNIPPSACKYYVNITDALHCQFANNNFTCATGQVFTGCNSSPLSLSTLYNSVTGLLIPFLNFYLKEQCVEGEKFRSLFSNFSAASKAQECPPVPGCGVVPVKLKSFYGFSLGNRNYVKWETESETAFSFFEIYRGADIESFSLMDRVEANSNSSGANYSCTDELPFLPQTFYRLKMVDIDGQFSWSPVLSLAGRNTREDRVLIFPNPVRSIITTNIVGPGKLESAEVFDASGRNFLSLSNRNAAENLKIDVSMLHPGIYFMKVRVDNGVIHCGKFVKL